MVCVYELRIILQVLVTFPIILGLLLLFPLSVCLSAPPPVLCVCPPFSVFATLPPQVLDWFTERQLIVSPPHHPLQVLDWFTERQLVAYSISCGQSLLYNNIFPKHKERLGKKMSELVGSVAKMEIPTWRKHFDVVVACEDDDGEDIDVPLISIQFR